MSWQLGKIRFYWYSNSTESVFVYLGVIQCLNCRQIHPFPTKLLGSEYWYFIQMLNLLSHFVGSYPCSKVFSVCFPLGLQCLPVFKIHHFQNNFKLIPNGRQRFAMTSSSFIMFS